MLHPGEYDFDRLGERLRVAGEANAAIVIDIINATCRRFLSLGQGEKSARLAQLIRSEAWTDVTLMLLDLELPLWQMRRLAYDEGEWYCALSRERELPDWLDRCIETRHTDLSLAILSALVEVQRISQSESRPSVPLVNRAALDFYAPLCSENFH